MKTFIIPRPDEKFGSINITKGYGNGYVVIPKGHLFYESHYDVLDLDVHGGLTFSDYARTLPEEFIPDEVSGNDWVIGFDTAHYGDNKENCPKEFVEKEIEKLVKQIKEW